MLANTVLCTEMRQSQTFITEWKKMYSILNNLTLVKKIIGRYISIWIENVGGRMECGITNLGFRSGFKSWVHHILAGDLRQIIFSRSQFLHLWNEDNNLTGLLSGLNNISKEQYLAHKNGKYWLLLVLSTYSCY